ncbi:Carbon-nitrogen hydrolase [Cyanidiococcus yangmingshanensis]|uniref:Carbon-nitrogen hydrolase n=1 Tax=Cyanidiococcus yangmingshanensis TaxID=2690220 RepID=A0A7J7IQS8_9RHOD|nr:Carbon-nitrogen hydrolase [Cyanidiococcus yangmingshanensis]
MSSTVSTTLRVALCQVRVDAEKRKALANAQRWVEEAVKQGAKLVVLPECFNCPYDTRCFPTYAEELSPVSKGDPSTDMSASETASLLQKLARAHGIYLVGGSIPERSHSDQRIYNTSLTFGPRGELLARHRKVHLFDVDVPGGIRFRESDVLSAGESLTSFALKFGDSAIALRIGVGICYDIRFPEMAAAMTRAPHDADMLVYPGAFNMTTGPAHWELLIRARALDNQVFVCACSPARDPHASYTAYGHSMIASPWGDVLARTDEHESLVIADVDPSRIMHARNAIPVRKQRRPEVYTSQPGF